MLRIQESLQNLTSDESVKSRQSVESQLGATDSNASKNEVRCLESEANEGMYNKVDNNCEDNNLVIENSLPDTNSIQERLPEGRRIADLGFVWKEIHRTFNNHARGIECQFKDWKLVNSRRYGLLTQLFFKCQMCNYEDNIWSEPVKKSEILDINRAAVVGSMTIGIGYAQLKELCAAMNIPCMSEVTYIKIRDLLVEDFQKTAMENTKMAGEAEKQLALERNDVINGVPYITVIADGSWMKRSYGNAYNSLSGMGVIIGYHTKKVLFTSVRNKFCAICDMAERNNIEPKAHKCYKNFDRNASSTSMESEIITEGFKCSLEMHGLIYKTVIADGDSSVYQSIRDNNPYHEQMVTVKKIECTNHLLRNLCKKLTAVAEMTQPKTQRQRGFVQMRKVVKSNIFKIRQEVEKAAEARRKEQIAQHRKAVELQNDILNIPSHVFGEHKRCKALGRICKNNGNNAENNHVPLLKVYGLYVKIENAIKYLSGYSESLILNYTNNPAESFNSIICKEIGGKRINFGKRGSYNARVAGAVIQYNTQQVLTELHQSMCKTVPPIVENLEKQRQRKVARTKESRETQGRPRKLKRESKTDRHYGPQSQRPDLSPDRVEQLRQHHVEKLAENAKDWQKIELNTRDQSQSELWLSLRREMLTASNFGTVCRMRPTTSCAATVKAILYPSITDTAAMTYGRENEEVAKNELALKLKKQIKPCGLFIDTENPYLGASPDGVIDENGLVEIKCPLSAENVTAEKAIETISCLKGIFDKKDPQKMNKNHRYYYQIQGQLNITKRDYCVFSLWTPQSMKVVHVNRDNAFWKNKMLPLLIRFYYECMLPELLDSRYNRNMPIRNPKYIEEAKEAATKINSTKSIRQNLVKNENIISDKEQTCDISPTQTIMTAKIAENMELDNDCTYIGTSYKQFVTEEDKARTEMNLNAIIPIEDVRKNVLSGNLLSDDALDLFLRVVRQTTTFETQSVQYQGCHPDYIDASQNDKSLQIIGGKNTWTGEGIEHWRCIFCDNTKLYVYDSMPGCTYDKLVAKEKNYIRYRYPQIKHSDMIFEKLCTTQPDGASCEVYAAAFATTVTLGGNPCNVQYSRNVKCMRQHFMKIIENNKLLPFPTR